MSPSRRPPSRLADLLGRIGSGYRSLGRGIGGVLLFLAFLIVATAALVLPLWLLATHAPRVFTLLCLAGFGLGLSAAAFASIRNRSRALGGMGPWARRRLLPALGRVGAVLGLLLSVYGLLLLLAARRYLPAAGAGAVLAVLIGLWAHRRAAPRSPRRPADDREDETPS